MADNDRLANGGSLDANPGWKADVEVKYDTPLLTQNFVGTGWKTSDETRMVMTKNAAGLPGWRARIFVPANLAQITVSTSDVVVTDTSDYIIPSGSYVDKGTQLRLHHNLGDTKERGCKATIQRQGETDLNYWLTNYVDSANGGHNFKLWTIYEDTNVIAESRDRVTALLGCSRAGAITASVNGSSWGPRGYQTLSGLALNSTFQNITSLEFFQGDTLNTSYVVGASYDWGNFTAGPVPQTTAITPTFGANGGSYNFVMSNLVTYIAMDALVPTSFYLYQPDSTIFVNTKVSVETVPNVRVHKTGITLPLLGEDINYGKNGAAGSHPRLYAGTKLTLTTTAINSYIAANLITSDTTTMPSTSRPTSSDSYSSVSFTMSGTAIFAVALYYIKTNQVQSSKTVTKTPRVTDTYSTFSADPNERLNANLVFVKTTAWGLPNNVQVAWLQNWSWEFIQESTRGQGPGPATILSFPENRSGSSVDSWSVTTDEIENGIFSYSWTGGVSAYTGGVTFNLVMAGQCMNYVVGPPPNWLNDLGSVIVTWKFTPVLIIVSGSA